MVSCVLGSLVAVECSGWEPHSRQEEGPGWLLCWRKWAQKLLTQIMTCFPRKNMKYCLSQTQQVSQDCVQWQAMVLALLILGGCALLVFLRSTFHYKCIDVRCMRLLSIQIVRTFSNRWNNYRKHKKRLCLIYECANKETRSWIKYVCRSSYF
jgi:hypothetical protein